MENVSESFHIESIDGVFALSRPCDYENWRDVNAWLSDTRPNELDVGNVTCLDPFGARALIDARLRNRNFRLVNLNESVRRALDHLGVLEYLTAGGTRPH